MFNRWVEAVPSKDQSAATVIKFRTREVMTRFGIPSEISSDKTFVQRTQTSYSTFACQIKTRLRPNPQPQGMVERVNGTLKTKN